MGWQLEVPGGGGRGARPAGGGAEPGIPVTVCVVCYGDRADLAGRFLEMLYRNTDAGMIELRAGLNEVSAATRALFDGAQRRYGNVVVWDEPENTYKNPLMRRMFVERPLEREWVVWFDDDSYPVRPDWLRSLAETIAARPGIDQWGQVAVATVGEEVRRFVEAAPWFRGHPLASGGDPADLANPYRIDFVNGGFWAIRSGVIRALDWPDPRIVQFGEDFLLGEALRQGGFSIGQFDRGVAVNTAERRNPGDRAVCSF